MVGSVGVGLAYVLGMVFPLYIASWFLDRGNFLAKPLWRKKLGEIRLAGKIYIVFLANVVGGAIFAGLGLVTIFLALTGKLGMPEADERIGQVAEWLGRVTGGIPLVNVVFVIVVGVILGKLVDRAVKKGGK